jgi:ubiquinone/menaquinone biosynthesis C-methylase UbiE
MFTGPTMSEHIDRINRSEMRKPSIVHHYSYDDRLTKAEQAALDRVAHTARGRRILDIGVGGGRTVKAMMQVSTNYLGVDNSHGMIEACRQRYPGATFELADARKLSNVPDASVHLVMFSCNGIGMVNHADRALIQREVHRVLEPGGVFLFSTHNKNCPDESAGFKLPELALSPNPIRTLVRLARFSLRTTRRLYRRTRLRKHEVRTGEYSIINDVCHDYGVMLYYITLPNQRLQLESIGFCKDAEAFDLIGEPITCDTTHSSMMFVARKPVQATHAVAPGELRPAQLESPGRYPQGPFG